LARILVTGGAGFIGSHLCDALLKRGDSVICVDNLITGQRANAEHLLRHRGFSYQEQDITSGLHLDEPLDAVVHLASLASPVAYLEHPLETLTVGSHGTENALELARRSRARFLLASTSEVYGSPAVSPQPEEYWGNVNPVGPRSVYDESKRFAEALTAAYRRHLGLDTGIARIFNTYGPRMSAGDGRVITNFVVQALASQPLQVYGDGSQTRSFCYIDDLIRGLLALLDSAQPGPLNLGNPEEISISDLAALVLRISGASSGTASAELPVDDPPRRRPDISKAAHLLGWKPRVGLDEGIRLTMDWLRGRPEEMTAAISQEEQGAPDFP